MRGALAASVGRERGTCLVESNAAPDVPRLTRPMSGQVFGAGLKSEARGLLERDGAALAIAASAGYRLIMDARMRIRIIPVPPKFSAGSSRFRYSTLPTGSSNTNTSWIALPG